MTDIRVGVIGVGVMGERHCRVYANLPKVDVVGVVDTNPDRGQEVANRYDTTYLADYKELLDKVDAVSIVTTTPYHFDIAMEALARDVHVLVEKPITETLEQGEILVAEAHKRNKVLQVGHIERFNPTYMELKKITDTMSLVAINIQRLSPSDTSNVDVDVIRDLMIHDLDLVTDLVNSSVEGFDAWGRSISTSAIDHAVVNLSFREGPIATISASRITEGKVRAIDVIAEGAYIQADLLTKTLEIHKRTFPQFTGEAQFRQESIIQRIFVPPVEPLVLELRHFIKCVLENQPSDVPGEAGLHALRLAQGVTDRIDNMMLLSQFEPQT